MRIAWFTPLSVSTGIARYSLAVLRALTREATVEVWAQPADNDFPLDWCPVHVIGDPAEAARETEGFDLRVYNLGNNPPFHSEILATYERARGVVVIHDKAMHSYFHDGPQAHYRRLMRYFYGREGSRAARRALANGALLSDGDFIERFPLIEPCLWNAEGIVAHSAHSAEALRRRYGDVVPVEWLPLPLCQQDATQNRPAADRLELGLPEDRIVVLVAGQVGQGKRIDVTIEAIASSAVLREQSVLVVAGGGDPRYRAALQALAESKGVGNVVRFVSQADDWLMQSYLQQADICVNLRYPSTESSSASLVEQLHFGKPTVVNDIGVYSEMPDDIVVKVPVESGAAGVRAAIERLIAAPAERQALGERAAAFALEHHMPETYAKGFLTLAERLCAQRDELARIDRTAETLTGYRSLGRLRMAANRVAVRLAADEGLR